MSPRCWLGLSSRAPTACSRSASRAGPGSSAAWPDAQKLGYPRPVMTARRIDASAVAREFRDQLRQQVAQLAEPLTLVGFLASEAAPSRTYADYTRIGCEDLGIRFGLRQVARLEVEDAIQRANDDPAVHG